MGTEPVVKMTEREALLMAYIDAKEVSTNAKAKCDAAQEALKKNLGDTTETEICGLKILYKYNNEIDTARLKIENPAAYKKCITEFDVTLFRTLFPELVAVFERKSKTRPLKLLTS